MKLVLSRESLLKPLQMLAGVIEHKQTMPVLANVLIIADQSELSIIATDTEIEIIGNATLAQPLAAPLRLTLPCRKLLDICRALPDGARIDLNIEANKVILRSGRSRYSLATLPAEDFPQMQLQESATTFAIPQNNLRYLLQRTFFAMAQQDVRYFLNGLLLEFLPHAVNAIATDGHRLAFNTITSPFPGQELLRIIVPRKSVLELIKLLDVTEEEVSIEITSNNIRVIGTDFMFTSKLLEGKFPDYQQAIPRGGNQILLERDPFKQALSRSSILSSDKLRVVFFEFKKNLLRIFSDSAEKRESAEEEMEIEYPYEEIGVGFNVSYLLDVLSALSTEQVVLTLSGGGSIVLEEPDNRDSVFVVMPMRM